MAEVLVCLVGVHFGFPVVHDRAAEVVSAEGGGFGEAHLSAPVYGSQELAAVGAPQGGTLVPP